MKINLDQPFSKRIRINPVKNFVENKFRCMQFEEMFEFIKDKSNIDISEIIYNPQLKRVRFIIGELRES